AAAEPVAPKAATAWAAASSTAGPQPPPGASSLTKKPKGGASARGPLGGGGGGGGLMGGEFCWMNRAGIFVTKAARSPSALPDCFRCSDREALDAVPAPPSGGAGGRGRGHGGVRGSGFRGGGGTHPACASCLRAARWVTGAGPGPAAYPTGGD